MNDVVGEDRQRQQLDVVGDEDVQEKCHRQRHYEEGILRHVLLDQPAKQVIAPLEHRLHLAGCTCSQPRPDPEGDAQGCQHGDAGGDERVVVERAEQRVGAHADRGMHARRLFGQQHQRRATSRSALPASTN